jgi:hypothetical protein
LITGFMKIEATAEEPILPLRILANPTRAAANAARGLGYAGMYGMVFFLTQFLQDVQHDSPLITGIGFLPTPISVFLSSEIASKVLMKRVRPKVLMLAGLALSAGGLALLTQVGARTSYGQLLAGAALGLAVLVTVFDSVTTQSRSSGLSVAAPGSARTALTHGMDITFGVGGAFALAALTVVAALVRTPTREPQLAPEVEFEMEPAA